MQIGVTIHVSDWCVTFVCCLSDVKVLMFRGAPVGVHLAAAEALGHMGLSALKVRLFNYSKIQRIRMWNG